jgi:hypothetical protein
MRTLCCVLTRARAMSDHVGDTARHDRRTRSQIAIAMSGGCMPMASYTFRNASLNLRERVRPLARLSICGQVPRPYRAYAPPLPAERSSSPSERSGPEWESTERNSRAPVSRRI